MDSYLFKDFKPISAKAWKQKIQADLKGADYNQTLLWHSNEGITVKPFYTKEDNTNRQINLPKKEFKICQSIDVKNEKKANFLAIDALNRGANAIEFLIKKPFNYRELLQNIDVKKVYLYFKFEFFTPSFILELAEYTHSKKSYFNIDPIGKLAKTGNWFTSYKEDVKGLQKIITTNRYTLAVNATIYQNAGANCAQQLAYALAHANEYLHIFGSNVASYLHFNFSVGSNYFFEIAKLRAFRLLWKTLLKEYHTTAKASIFVQPSLRNKTLYDYNVNMLRTTSECMSAILGGANTISNIAYDYVFNTPNEFGERIARNQLLILKEETQIKNAQHIADGAYYIESLTEQLAQKALEIFKQIEQGGGFLNQLQSGIIQQKTKESAYKEQTAFNTGNTVLLGTNKVINKQDQMKNNINKEPFVKKRNVKTLVVPFVSKRLAEEVEQERLQNE